jgi:hypothetical protein
MSTLRPASPLAALDVPNVGNNNADTLIHSETLLDYISESIHLEAFLF